MILMQNHSGCLLRPRRLDHYFKSYLKSIFFDRKMNNLKFIIEIRKSDEVQRCEKEFHGFAGQKIMSIGPLSAEL